MIHATFLLSFLEDLHLIRSECAMASLMSRRCLFCLYLCLSENRHVILNPILALMMEKHPEICKISALGVDSRGMMFRARHHFLDWFHCVLRFLRLFRGFLDFQLAFLCFGYEVKRYVGLENLLH